MTVVVIALVTINDDDPEALAAYLAATTPLLEKAGAKLAKRFDINEVVVGHRPAKSVLMVEYPSKEAVEQVFSSAAYAQIKPMRDRAFLDYHISIADTAKT